MTCIGSFKQTHFKIGLHKWREKSFLCFTHRAMLNNCVSCSTIVKLIKSHHGRLVSVLDAVVVMTCTWTLVCVCLCVLLASEDLFWVYWLHHSQLMTTVLQEAELCREEHMEKLLSVWKISATSRLGTFRKSIFSFSVRAFPEDNEFDREFKPVLASSAVFHHLSPIVGGGDSTMINVLPSIFQLSAAHLPLSLFPLVSQLMRQIRDELPFHRLIFFSLTWESAQFTSAHMHTDLLWYIKSSAERNTRYCQQLLTASHVGCPCTSLKWHCTALLWTTPQLFFLCPFSLLLWWSTVLKRLCLPFW